MDVEWVRPLAFVVFAVSGLLSITSWALRTRRIRPFTRTSHLLRRLSDPLIIPIENRLHKSGGNPVNAPWWLFGGGMVVAVLLVTSTDWIARMLYAASFAADRGPAAMLWFAVHLAGELVILALWVRVIGSWVGVHRYTSWMRPAYILTDWIVEPLRRALPNVGMFDISPLVAYVILYLVLRSLP
jgi:YggT family protein